ncbi:sensor histidine kinase [Jiella pacifica]|uniref:histidine kinase n=1 Tax=Jiella pacifica TaxID=2696469 RepID=A0A6N9T749_9HYPH|nr:HWE histidine kinase domain-containing protein [Jiella pacifica]NDW05579.1 GAF domain-containing protein [Jiella pacifica]
MSRPEHSTWRLSVADLVAAGPEEAIDRVTRLAARMLGVSGSFVVIVDGDRQILKSETGLPPRADAASPDGLRLIAGEGALFRHVIETELTLSVDDVRADPRFAGSAFSRSLEIGAFLGVPVGLPDGSTAGAFCVFDRAPRRWTEADRLQLEEFRAVLAGELAFRQEVKQRKHLEQRAFLVSREMEHRIKNSLSSVQALILLSVREGQSASEIRNDLLERVASLAKTQSLLADRDGKGALFADIVTAELQHFGIGTNVWIDGPEVLIGKDDAISVAMVVHELATNATKHGALAPQVKGGVAVRWQKALRDGRTAMTFRWEEWFGGGAPPDAAQTAGQLGFGTELLETLVLRQMRGEMARELTPGGFSFTATVRLADVPA